MNKHYFYADDWDLMKKLMRKGVRLYCEEQGLSNDKDFRIVSLSTKGDWGHILNFSRCCDYPLNQDRKWEPFDAYYGKVYCDEDAIKNIIPKNDDKLKELLKQIRDSGIDSKTIINALSNNKNESMELDEAKKILNDKGYILEKVLPKYKQFELYCKERFKEISDQVKEIGITEYNLDSNQFKISISGGFCTIDILSNGRKFSVNLSIEDNGKKLYITNYVTEKRKILDIEMLDSEDLPRIVLGTYNEDLLANLHKRLSQRELSDLLNR